MKDLGKEFRHLINDYLVSNPTIICCGGFHIVSSAKLNQYLHKLEPFDAPDMYAVDHDNSVMIEHFEFDASYKTKKGMRGKREENLLLEQITHRTLDSTFHLDKPEYSISIKDWITNFESCFEEHYKRISAYRKKLQSEIGKRKSLVAFFIEHQYSPYIKIKSKILEVPYIYTIQFHRFFQKKRDVDFILFGTYYRGKRQLFYVDHDSESCHNTFIDLCSDEISLSKLNQSETILSGGFSVNSTKENK